MAADNRLRERDDASTALAKAREAGKPLEHLIALAQRSNQMQQQQQL